MPTVVINQFPTYSLFLFVCLFVLSFFVALKCADDQFPCVKVCIAKEFVCDEQDDCGDGADELDCDVITGLYVLCKVLANKIFSVM